MNEKYVEVTSEQIQGFSQLPLDGAFQMLNLLKFKNKVEETEETGAEAYAKYLEAITPFFKASGAKVVYQGKPLFTIIGPNDQTEWDKILIVEYASKEDFLNMITTKGYPTALRNRALEDSRLILCTI